MKMKKIVILISLLTLGLVSCSENERMIYNDKVALYFGNATSKDSVNFSFTMTKELQAELFVTVKIMGQTATADRAFQLASAPSTTAIEGVHYKKLEDHYIIPANRTIATIPITLLKTGDLDDHTFKLDLVILPNNDFKLGYDDYQLFQIRTTNMLVKPSYWASPLEMYFGVYSKVKHQKCIDIMGHDFELVKDSNPDHSVQYYMRQGRELATYFALNPTLDENGDLIETWSPF